MTARQFVRLVFAEAGRPAKLRVPPPVVLALLGLVNPTLRAVREQLYQLERPFVVDQSKFAKAFGTQVTLHRDAIRITLAWFAETIPMAADR